MFLVCLLLLLLLLEGPVAFVRIIIIFFNNGIRLGNRFLFFEDLTIFKVVPIGEILNNSVESCVWHVVSYTCTRFGRDIGLVNTHRFVGCVI